MLPIPLHDMRALSAHRAGSSKMPTVDSCVHVFVSRPATLVDDVVPSTARKLAQEQQQFDSAASDWERWRSRVQDEIEAAQVRALVGWPWLRPSSQFGLDQAVYRVRVECLPKTLQPRSEARDSQQYCESSPAH